MSTLKIVPKQGLVIRDPDRKGEILPPEGKLVAKLSPFWSRRRREGSIDVIEAFQVPTTRPSVTIPARREEV